MNMSSNPPAYMKSYHQQNPHKWRIASRKYYHKFRQQILEFYGKKCGRCGFDDVRALQIDHVHGGGTKEVQGQNRIFVYRRALKNPEDYQLLCANCNWIKRDENQEKR